MFSCVCRSYRFLKLTFFCLPSTIAGYFPYIKGKGEGNEIFFSLQLDPLEIFSVSISWLRHLPIFLLGLILFLLSTQGSAAKLWCRFSFSFGRVPIVQVNMGISQFSLGSGSGNSLISVEKKKIPGKLFLCSRTF